MECEVNLSHLHQMLPLVAAQPGIWIADQISSYDNAYMVAHYLELTGDLDVPSLSEAILRGMSEADTLQMKFVEDEEGQPTQVPSSQSLPKAEIYDFTTKFENELEARSAAHAYMKRDLGTNIRLNSGNPLIKNAILKITPNCWFWYQRYHHIQLDGYSFTMLTRRIADIYRSIISHQAIPETPFTPFADVVKEYEDYYRSPTRVKDAEYWKEAMKSMGEATSLSSTPLPDSEPSTDLLRIEVDLDRNQFFKLCLAGRADRISNADIALALISLWLLRLTDSKSINLGFIFMRRFGSVALTATGPVINVLPISLEWQDKDDFIQFAKSVGKTLRKVKRHQRYDAEQVLRDSNATWESNPPYGPVLNYKAFDYALDFGQMVSSKTHHLAAGPVRDLEIALFTSDEGDIRIEILANKQRYDLTTLQAHMARLPLLLESLASQTGAQYHQANILLTDELEFINNINETRKVLDNDLTLVSLLEEQASSTPQALSLADESTSLTYVEMNQRAKLLAQNLSKLGVKGGDIVAVALPRSVDLSLSLQGILIVGAAYLPLDVDYPDERLHLMLEDAKPRLVITDVAHLERVSSLYPDTVSYRDLLTVNDISTQEVLLHCVRPSDKAYIIYTSGSTGKPKGVVVSHRAIVNRLLWMKDQYKFTARDTILQKTPCSFDVSVWEFFLPLITGARLFMAPVDAHRDPSVLQALISKHGVTTIHFVPSMLALYLENIADSQSREGYLSLKRVFCSGEALPTSLARQWEHAVGVPLYNLYGPTEAAVDVSSFNAFGDDLAKVRGGTVPIGFPVWNTKLFVLDKALCIMPPGIAGELFISGVQLAEGYLNRPQLTNERFIPSPLSPGERMYRTGDVARMLPDGALEFLGRTDDQVKIRGQRIELGEIDAALQAFPGVFQAVTVPLVLSRSSSGSASAVSDQRQLVSYVVGSDLDTDNMLELLKQSLPPHMAPVALVKLDKLPLSANGKVDKKTLPLPVLDVGSKTPPAHGLEQVIAKIYEELLHCGTVYAEDDFFSLGGHSLLAVKLVAALRKKLELPVTIGQIMKTPSIRALAQVLGDSENQDLWKDAGFESVLTLRSSTIENGPTLFCVHPASGYSWQFSILQKYLDKRWSIVGIQSAQLDGPLASSDSLDALIDSHYKTLRQFQSTGPYYLIGYSLGGTLAHALAARLKSAGENVDFLGLLDTWPPETQNWDEKQGKNVVDPEVIEEMQRERKQFEAAQQGVPDQLSGRLFETIELNYASAVRLLATARSSRFDGCATLFLASRTYPEGTDINEVWRPWVKQLETSSVDCSHVDIMSPQTFADLGPQIQKKLNRFLNVS